MSSSRKESLLVVSTTYPRWADDNVPLFVHELSRRLVGQYQVVVLAPHYKGAKTEETIDSVLVYRFKYAPQNLELLCYEGGMLSALATKPLLWGLLPVFVLSFLYCYAKLVLKYKVKKVHCHWMIPLCPFILLARNLFFFSQKVVMTVHGGDIYSFRGGIGKTLKKWCIRNADKVLAVSSAVKDDLLQLECSCGNIEVLSMGVSPIIPGKLPKARSGILFVGRLVEKKGVKILIDAISVLKDKGCVLKLVIAGDGPLRGQLEERVNLKGVKANVEFQGWVAHKEVNKLYETSEMVVVPSIEASSGDAEGLGLVAAEAICGGAIVVASDLPAIQDVVIDGETGFLFVSGSVSSLVRKIEEIQENKGFYRNMLSEAAEIIADKYSWGVIAEKHELVFNRV